MAHKALTGPTSSGEPWRQRRPPPGGLGGQGHGLGGLVGAAGPACPGPGASPPTCDAILPGRRREGGSHKAYFLLPLLPNIIINFHGGDGLFYNLHFLAFNAWNMLRCVGTQNTAPLGVRSVSSPSSSKDNDCVSNLSLPFLSQAMDSKINHVRPPEPCRA